MITLLALTTIHLLVNKLITNYRILVTIPSTILDMSVLSV